MVKARSTCRRCNGEALQDLGPFEVLDELCKAPFHPRKRKQGHEVEVEDGGLLGLLLSRIYKFLWKRVLWKR